VVESQTRWRSTWCGRREAAREAEGREDFIPINKVGASRESGRRARLLREEDEVAEELTERIGFTMKETKKEDEYNAKVTKPPDRQTLNFSTRTD